MKVTRVIEALGLGAFVGCFIGLLVMVLVSLQYDLDTLIFNGHDVINLFSGSIVAGWGFSLTGLIYEKEDIILPFQIIFQMGIGMTVLFAIAIYLKWMPINLGWMPILTWIVIAVIFAVIFWCGFYIYYSLMAKNLTKKLKKH